MQIVVGKDEASAALARSDEGIDALLRQARGDGLVIS
jgi:hypothetical protein